MESQSPDEVLNSALAETGIAALYLTLAKTDPAHIREHVDGSRDSCAEASRLLALVPDSAPGSEAVRLRIDALLDEIRSLEPEDQIRGPLAI